MDYEIIVETCRLIIVTYKLVSIITISEMLPVFLTLTSSSFISRATYNLLSKLARQETATVCTKDMLAFHRNYVQSPHAGWCMLRENEWKRHSLSLFCILFFSIFLSFFSFNKVVCIIVIILYEVYPFQGKRPWIRKMFHSSPHFSHVHILAVFFVLFLLSNIYL